MNVDEYLGRIGVAVESVRPDESSLRHLQRSHLLTVPFENLDIHWNRPIILDRDRFYEKIVLNRRGGFCYELNGLFDMLLRDVGFDTKLVSARVFNGTEHGPEFDHAAIVVTVDERQFLVDVGFGAFTAEPLLFTIDLEQTDATGDFLIRYREDGYFEILKREKGVWRSEYMFQDDAHELSDFTAMCDFQQYAPESHFRKGKLCSIMTPEGRKTLTDKSLIITSNGQKNERAVPSDSAFYAHLIDEFGIAPSHD